VIQEPLIGISEASQLLGVSEVSLRQWTDAGKVKAFITPGGHRRYSRLGLKKFMSSQCKSWGTRDLAAELEDSTAKHRETISAFLRDNSWYSQLDTQSQEELSSLGRRLLDLIIRAITEPSRQDEVVEEVRKIGYGFGEILTRLKFPLVVSVQAFTQHRDLIINVTAQLIKRRQGLTPRLVETIPVIDHALDEALVGLMTAYQQNKDSLLNSTRKEMHG
jgi:excisionase family DNA binding protein